MLEIKHATHTDRFAKALEIKHATHTDRFAKALEIKHATHTDRFAKALEIKHATHTDRFQPIPCIHTDTSVTQMNGLILVIVIMCTFG